jgi:hypothetical protein
MPYIITTANLGTGAEPDALGLLDWAGAIILSQRAVATLDKARAWAHWSVAKTFPHHVQVPREVVRGMDAAERLPENGGTIGPLPDGTVIEVEQVLLNADGEWESEDGSK